jgi:hypothetical protein
MEHPLIGSLESLNQEQLLGKISELQNKLMIAYRTGNGHLCDQIRMAIDSYNSAYQEKIRSNKGGENFDDIIDIK